MHVDYIPKLYVDVITHLWCQRYCAIFYKQYRLISLKSEWYFQCDQQMLRADWYQTVHVNENTTAGSNINTLEPHNAAIDANRSEDGGGTIWPAQQTDCSGSLETASRKIYTRLPARVGISAAQCTATGQERDGIANTRNTNPKEPR